MSGNKERAEENTADRLACPNCGSFNYVMESFGSSAEYVNVRIRDHWTSDWEAYDGEPWKCDECGQRASEAVRVYLDSVRWYTW